MKIKRLMIHSTFLCALSVQALLHSSHQHVSQSADLEWRELQASMAKMHGAMISVAASGDADVDFVRLMLPHHQAALDMAKSLLLHGESVEMRRLAQEIIADQQSELDLMQLWLKKHVPGGD
jgi:uncharacterized protein (DUF305 family)